MQHLKPIKYPRPVEGKSDGFVLIRFAMSDGSEGEKLVESANAEAVFNWLVSQVPPEATFTPRNQLTLDLKAS